MVAPRTTGAVRRTRTNGAELGRQRILALLQDGPHGFQYLQEEAHMSRLTLLQRLRELVDVVRCGEDPHGNRMAGLRRGYPR